MRGSSDSDSTLAIGGVEIRVHSEIEFAHYPADFYAPFLLPRSGCADCTSAIDVRVHAEEAPAGEGPVLFDTDSSWYLQRQRDGYRIAIRKGTDARNVIAAVCDAGTTEADVYVGRGARLCEGGLPGTEYEVLANPVSYPLDQLLVMNHLVSRGGVIVHAAAVIVDGKALVLAGASGAGKSTISRLLISAGLGDSLLTDDRIVVRTDPAGVPTLSETQKSGATVWGTPWAGDARIARNGSAPLGGLFILHQAGENAAVPIDAGQALQRMMPVASIPWYDPEQLQEALDICGSVVGSAPCYELHFRPDEDVVALLLEVSRR